MTTASETTAERQTGLTSAEVADRVARGQVNALTERTSRSLAEIFKANVLTRFNAILGALFVLVMVTGSFADGLFGGVLVLNSAIGIAQEYLAKRKLDRLALLNSPTTRVVRDGDITDVPTSEVVLDDLIELRTGDEVPADGTLTSANGLELDESNLTGEADPVPHTAGDTIRSGTTVVSGSGRYSARAVGADAYVNRIAADARRFTRTKSEIQDSINTLLTYITWVIVVALPVALWSQWRAVGEQGWREVVIRSAAGVVGLVPEGLVLLTSVAFLLSAVQLTRQQVLVQQLPAVEGLARVDVVCVDKTGTLTVGDIAFETLHALGGQDADTTRLALGAIADDPFANGTLLAIGRVLPPPGWTRTDSIAFNSTRKWSAATFEGHGTWVLGAPEVLLAQPAGSGGRPGRGRPACRDGRPQRTAARRHDVARRPDPGRARDDDRAGAARREADLRVLRRTGRRGQGDLRRQPGDGRSRGSRGRPRRRRTGRRPHPAR